MGNVAQGTYTTIGGGWHNEVYGDAAVIAGGFENLVKGATGLICGGARNIVSDTFGAILGGNENTVEAPYGTIAGGGGETMREGSRVVDGYGFVGGGSANVAGSDDGIVDNSQHATVAGGLRNAAIAEACSIAGGINNVAGGFGATIGGGSANETDGPVATIAGGGGNWVAGGIGGTVGGGGGNTVHTAYGTVGGGAFNLVVADFGTIAGGGLADPRDLRTGNRVFARYGTVCGGADNKVGVDDDDPGGSAHSTIGGGLGNTVLGLRSTVSGGALNVAAGDHGTIGGGQKNVASGLGSTIPGGVQNAADADYSFASGRMAHAAHQGTFVWADSTPTEFSSSRANEFSIRASGGVRLVTDATNKSGVVLAPGSGSWSSLSDASAIEHVEPVDSLEILALTVQLPIHTWSYVTEDDSVRHIGPTSQEFLQLFALGDSNGYITSVDADGVAMASIQGLFQLHEQDQLQLAELSRKNRELEARIAALERLIGAATPAP